ncbi:MAG: autotransporter-associated beta strand repeat-containing protein [Verrucomicrobiales bacterium]|jgi:autotransporter-associated beta strand protein|nr:autotransporter-associated beta strand repeat-containing protein [Verrucomicrobiales bacterium]
MKTNQHYLLKLALTVTLSLSAAFGDLVAATWKGATGETGTNFNVEANWDGNVPPVADAALVFGTNAADSDTLNNDFTSWSFGNFTFSAGAPSYTISGNAFTWNNNSTLTNNSGILQTVATNITAPAGVATYTVNGNSSVALTGTISASGGALTIQNQLDASGTLTLGGANVSGGNFTYTINKSGLTAVIGDIYAPNGTLSLTNRSFMFTVWLTGSNQFAADTKSGLGPVELYLDYRNSNYGKFTGMTGGFDMYGTEFHLLGGTTIEQVGFLNASANAYRASVLIDRGGVSGSSAILSSSIWDGGMLYDLSDSALLGSTNAGEGNTNGIARAWITIGANNGAGRDFVFRKDDNLYYAYEGYTDLGSGNTANALVSGGTIVSANVTANSLKITATTGGHLDLNGNTLTLTSGGLLYTGTGDYTIGGESTVTGVLNTGNTDLVIWQSGDGALTVNADLTNKGLRISGGGALILNGVSNGTGSTVIDIDNYVRLGADQSIASGNLYMSVSSTLELNGHSQKVASLLGGNSIIGLATIINSDLVNTATLTVGALDGPATAGAGGLANLTLSGNIHLVISGTNMNASHTRISRALNISGGVEFKDIILTPARAAADSYWFAPWFNSVTFLTGTTGDLSFSGNGAVQFEGNNNITISNNIAVTGTNNWLGLGYSWTFSGAVTAAPGAELTFGWNSRSANNNTVTFSGAMDAMQGTLYLASQSGDLPQEFFALTDNAANLSNGAVVLALMGDNDTTITARTVTLQATASGTYRIGELSTENITGGGATLRATDAAIVRSTAAAPVTFAIGSGVFDGHLTNSGTANNGVITDTGIYPVSLDKVGPGTLTLTNLNTYTGTTTVSGGVLLLSGNGNLANTSAVTVSGGTLQLTDSGTINSTVNVEQHGVLLVDTAYEWTRMINLNAGGVLGGSGTINTWDIEFTTADAGVTGGGLGTIGTLTFDKIQLWGDFTYYFDILSETDHDQLIFVNGLDLQDSNQYILQVNNLNGLTEFNNVSILSGQLDDYDETKWQLGEGFSLNYNGSALLLSYSIPEPSTWLLLGAGATLLVFLRRRR